MDARCNQVYNALFRVKDQKVERLCDDRAVSIDEVKQELIGINEPIIIAGDGAGLFESFAEENENLSIAAEPVRYQNASGVALAAEEFLKENIPLSCDELMPFYLRLPQAERELKAKQLKGE
jgi:tRNA threonylcarbamoyladenosine biosynthesis protein TsaB